ncbi:MAG TPA: hypothetical protein PLP17_15865 [Oligoflexia bacterium]|nr:hypothetical protein [Oligoflexia bacterium]
MKVVVLYTRVSPKAPQDELDIVVQAKAVSECLQQVGHECELLDFATLDMGRLRGSSARRSPTRCLT